MQVLHYDIATYCDLERDLCSLHSVPQAFEGIGGEWHKIQQAFRGEFGEIPEGGYEFPDWHHNIRMLWVYLYSDQFYTPEFIGRVQRVLAGMEEPWFAQFECYSPSLESPELPTGAIGTFMIYKASVAFCDDDGWKHITPKLGV